MSVVYSNKYYAHIVYVHTIYSISLDAARTLLVTKSMPSACWRFCRRMSAARLMDQSLIVICLGLASEQRSTVRIAVCDVSSMYVRVFCLCLTCLSVNPSPTEKGCAIDLGTQSDLLDSHKGRQCDYGNFGVRKFGSSEHVLPAFRSRRTSTMILISHPFGEGAFKLSFIAAARAIVTD